MDDRGGRLKRISKVLSPIAKSMEASHLQGIRVRTRIAIFCALFFIAINTLLVALNYNRIPDVVPGFHDTNGVFVKAVHKSAFFLYELEFLSLLLIVALVARVIKPLFKEPIVFARTRCLLFDITNLYITTVVGITMILLAIARGDGSVELSYFSQLMIFLFWTLVMVLEFVFDLKKIRKQQP